VRRWHLIVIALLAACEQWKAPQRINKLEDKVNELAEDVAALQGPAARKARQKEKQNKADEAHGGDAAKDGEHAGSGDGDGAAKVAEPASGEHEKADKGHDEDKGEKADKGHDEDKPEKSDKGHDEDKPEKSEKGHDGDKPEKSEKGHGEDKGDKPDKADKGDEVAHTDKSEKSEKSDKPDDGEKGDKPKKHALDQINAAVANSLAAAKSKDGAKPHWTYDGRSGPSNWGLLDPSYSLCADGKEQSPIDIEPHASKASPIAFHYKPTAATVVDNGHTLQVNLAAGSSIEIDGRVFDLIQFHFHTPSEHTIAGEHYPLEVHLVHQGPTGKLAVIGVLYDVGADSRPLAALWPPLSRKVGVAEKLPRPFDPTALLPETRTVFRYNGSLTTPPCTEGVVWNVMRRTMSDGRRHVEQFVERFSHNARDLQQRNERKVK
jgi:carbonic anhydrase